MIEYRLLKFGLVLYAAYLTYQVVAWSMAYTEVSDLDGATLALVIAAVQSPAMILNGYLAKLFSIKE